MSGAEHDAGDTGDDFSVATRAPANPFGQAPATGSVATVAASARENTEVMAMAIMAKRFPRDLVRVGDKIVNAFSRVGLAENAAYQFARGGTNITGPSIRAAEAMAQQWGNLENGWRELSRTVGPDGVGVSEVEAFSIDYESVSRESIRFVVRHWRDTKSGGYKLRDERDIYELCANQAQRRKRACILAQLPGDLVDAAMNQAAVTLTAKADTSAAGMANMLAAFAPYGVDQGHVEKRIQRKLEAITAAQVVTLKRIWASLRDGMSTPADWFDLPAGGQAEAGGDEPLVKGTTTSIAELSRRGAKPAAAPAAAPSPGATVATPEVDRGPVTRPEDERRGPAVNGLEPPVKDAAEAAAADDAREAATRDPAAAARLEEVLAHAIILVQSAKDGEIASLAVDQHRPPVLPSDFYDRLVAAWRAKWGGGALL